MKLKKFIEVLQCYLQRDGENAEINCGDISDEEAIKEEFFRLFNITKNDLNSIKMWIARDDDGDLYLYKSKPYADGGMFDADNGTMSKLSPELFPEVTFENSPREIILKLI